jgi:hypothetical protein
MFSERSITLLEKPQGAMVFNLARFTAGPETCLNNIPPGVPGTYSWFQNIKYPDAPDALYEALIRDIERPKFVERSGTISPYYNVGIRSFGKLSSGKQSRLKQALRNKSFRTYLHHAVENAILFQSPLYVGKAIDLQNRIRQHLAAESTLRLRLAQTGIAIDHSILLVCPLWISHEDEYHPEYEPSEDSEEQSNYDQDEELQEEQYEDLFEEIFSRLFSPQFTIRIG